MTASHRDAPANDLLSALPAPGLASVPGPLGKRVLLFEAVVLLEYWLAPGVLGVTNYAGLWSAAGLLLFPLVVASVAVFVLFPLLPHLRLAFRSRRNRWAFHGVWVGTLLAGLFATDIVQVTPGPASPALQFGTTTVYTPFGAWPSITTYLPALHLWGTWNVEGPTVLALLSLLSAASVVLGPLRARAACEPRPARAATWRTRLSPLGAFAPLAFVSGCPGCPPLYLLTIASVAPTAAVQVSAAIPLVPWIGFAGLVYLGGFAAAIALIRRATTSSLIVRSRDTVGA
jgi:hypothetical protein